MLGLGIPGLAGEAPEDTLQAAQEAVSEMAHKVEEVASEAAHQAAETVKHAEEAVEEAAAKGVFGGAMMWGWIALAALVILLIFFAT